MSNSSSSSEAGLKQPLLAAPSDKVVEAAPAAGHVDSKGIVREKLLEQAGSIDGRIEVVTNQDTNVS